MDKSEEQTQKNPKEGTGEKTSMSSVDRPECAVCLQPCVQPVQLPCRHIFCYLCVKGVTHRSKKCAMCRQEIPANYLENPVLVQVPQSNTVDEDDYQWFYEGRNGWWQYDERTSYEIESAYQKGEKQVEVLIAGFLYVIDFEEHHQYRRCDPFRQRRVKRDLSIIPKKGIAGIRIVNEPEAEGAHSSNSVKTSDNSTSSNEEVADVETEDTSDSDAQLNAAAAVDSEHTTNNVANARIPANSGRTQDSVTFQEARYNIRSNGKKQ